MARVLAAAAIVLCLLTSCATQSLRRVAKPICFSARVVVTADDGSGHLVAPGVPVDILVRSKRGNVLQAVKSDSEGKASLEVCWRDDDPAWQIEAKLLFAPQFAGTFASFFNYTDTYCLTLPQKIGGHCGEWGTGSSSLLRDEPPRP